MVVGHLEVLVVGVWAVAGCPRSEDKGKGKDKGKDWQPQELLQGLVQGRARDKARGVVEGSEGLEAVGVVASQAPSEGPGPGRGQD